MHIPAIAVASLIAFLAPPAAVAAAEPLRVVAWNIEWFPGKNRNPTPEDIKAQTQVVSKALHEINPDILLAQEIGSWEAFSEVVGSVPGLRPAVVSAFTSEQTGEYWPQQLAIGSKLPVLAAWSEPWRAGDPITPRRGFSMIAAKLPESDRLILFYSVHLKSNRASNDEERELNFATREESARQILQHVKEMEEIVFPGRIAGVVIGGDFNTNHDGNFGDRTIEMIEEGGFHNSWRKTNRTNRFTWRGNDQFDPVTFDYLFTKGIKKAEATLLDPDPATSDHRPLVLELELPK